MGAYAGPEIVNDGLVVCLDAANEKSYPGSGTTWTDLSGNGNNGTLVNGVGYDSANGGSLSFDGVDDYVQTSLFSGRNPSTNPISYSCWVYQDAAADEMFLVQGNWGSAARAYFGAVANTWGMGVQGSSWTAADGGSSASANTWYYITIVFDGSNCKMYVNGAFDFQKSYTSFAFNQSLQIGSTTYAQQYAWDGKISGIQVYDRALTAQEIAQNFNALRGRYGI